jgi:hypothetical protein
MKNTVNLKIPYNSPGQIWWEGVRGRGKFTLTLPLPSRERYFIQEEVLNLDTGI